jgi:hypothetical protein
MSLPPHSHHVPVYGATVQYGLGRPQCAAPRPVVGGDMDHLLRRIKGSVVLTSVVAAALCVSVLGSVAVHPAAAQDLESRQSATPPAFPEPDIFAMAPMRDGVKLTG